MGIDDGQYDAVIGSNRPHDANHSLFVAYALALLNTVFAATVDGQIVVQLAGSHLDYFRGQIVDGIAVLCRIHRAYLISKRCILRR